MRRKIFFLSLSILTLLNLSTSLNANNVDIYRYLLQTQVKSNDSINFLELVINYKPNPSEIYNIKSNCVFIIQMTSKESDSLESANPTFYEVFSESANNNSMEALELFEKLRIKNYWSDKRYLSFVYNEQKFVLDTRLKELAGKYCLLFNENKKPELILIDSLTEGLLINYFK
jgi:hypothetical protein